MSGPITERLLPYPLPVAQKNVLKTIAAEIRKARKFGRTEEIIDDAMRALDIATLNMRERIGVDVTRRCLATGGE